MKKYVMFVDAVEVNNDNREEIEELLKEFTFEFDSEGRQILMPTRETEELAPVCNFGDFLVSHPSSDSLAFYEAAQFRDTFSDAVGQT
jgi:hypothetical protein